MQCNFNELNNKSIMLEKVWIMVKDKFTIEYYSEQIFQKIIYWYKLFTLYE